MGRKIVLIYLMQTYVLETAVHREEQSMLIEPTLNNTQPSTATDSNPNRNDPEIIDFQGAKEEVQGGQRGGRQ
jgi:hypothetical protein